MKVFFTILNILLSSVIWAQTNNQIKHNYLVVYPIEALIGHLRIGYEKEFSSNNSFLIEGQYYFTDDRFRDYFISRNNYWGLALKSEVRFYENNEENKNRTFLGANLMVKRNENMRLDVGETFNNFVFSLNIKKGTEFFINKTKGKFTGWIGYTLAWTYRTFPDLNNGERYPNKYDRRHDVSIVGTYELNKKWTFSSVFVYGSGNAITLPTNYYFIQGQLIQDYSKLNNYRIFPYHRLDLSAIYKPIPKKNRKWQGTWAFSIYNVYSRQNPYFLYLDTQASVATGGITANVKQVSIFPILPSVTYNIKF